MTNTLGESFNLADPDIFLRQEANEVFRILRGSDPVHWSPGNETTNGFWSLTKYEDVFFVSRHPEMFISSKGIAGPSLRQSISVSGTADPVAAAQRSVGNVSIITMDPPQHVKMRRLVNKGFTPRAVNDMEPRIRAVTNQILDRIAYRDSCDFVLEVASQLPLAVICGMMGLDEKHWPLFFELTNKVLGATDPEYQTSVPEEERGTFSAARATAAAGVMGMMNLFREMLEERRGSRRENDLVTLLMEAEVDGEKLSEADILAFCFLLIVAGNETTRHGISGGLEALCMNPEEKSALLNDMTLIDSAVEEILRWTSPLHHMARTAMVDVEIRGKQIKKGDRILMWYTSVNRDEDVFVDPYRFNISRSPNEHLAFGIGAHFCLGAGFARKELRVMFEELFKRFPDVELAGPPEHLRSSFINGIKHLPVKYTTER